MGNIEPKENNKELEGGDARTGMTDEKVDVLKRLAEVILFEVSQSFTLLSAKG